MTGRDEMKVITIGHSRTLFVEINFRDFEQITGVELCRDHYGNGNGRDWSTIIGKEYDMSELLESIRAVRGASEVKKNVIAELETLIRQVDKAHWPAEIKSEVPK